MRVFICYERFSELFDISPNQTVGALKQLVKNSFLVQLSSDEQVRQYLELNYGGAALQDSWALCDIGITSGSTIRCLVKSEARPKMYVFNTVTRETLPVIGNECLLHTSVAKLKTIVSVQSGLPVSSFQLSTAAGVQLYDCNWVQDYSIERGTILRLETWDGWLEFLQGCLRGNRLTVQKHLSQEKPVLRFQLQVALYIAASSGHLDLASWLLERGASAEEPVGVHPYRQWCQQTAHSDTRKRPVHVAAESNQLLILKLFVTRNLFNLACRDPTGHDPLKIAIQHGYRDCVRFLANKLCSVVSFSNMSLPMRIYLQIKHWVSLGKKRAASSWSQYTSTAFKARARNKLLVDGFIEPKLTYKSREFDSKLRHGMKAKALSRLPPIWNLHSISHTPPSMATHTLPSLQPEKMMQKRQFKSNEKGGVMDEITDRSSSLWKRKFELPPLSGESISSRFAGTPVKSFHVLNAASESSHHSDQTLREKAVYCLTIASTFTEKPWMKQLNIARTLVRRHVH